MAVPFCEPSYHPREARERRRRRRQVEDTTVRRQVEDRTVRRQATTGVAVSQLSLSSRVLLWGLMETWRILTNVTNGEQVDPSEDEGNDVIIASTDDTDDQSEHDYELIINYANIDQPNNAIINAKEDIWIDSQVVDKNKIFVGDEIIGAPYLIKEEEILLTFDQDYCWWRTDAKTSPPRSTSPAHVETMNSLQQNLPQTRNTDTVSPQISKPSDRSTGMIGQQPSHAPPVNTPSTKPPDILSYTFVSPSQNCSSTSSDRENSPPPPNQSGLPDLLREQKHRITAHLPDLITCNTPPHQGATTSNTPSHHGATTSNIPPHQGATTSNTPHHGATTSNSPPHHGTTTSLPSPPQPEIGGKHLRKHARSKPLDFGKCGNNPHEFMAKMGGVNQEQIKTEAVDTKEDWKEVGRSLRRIAVVLESDEGQRMQRRRNSQDRCEDVRNRILENLKNCGNSRMISDLLVAFGLFGLLAIANKIENMFK